MATYDNDLRLKEIATGDESGTWGTSTNTNLELIAEAFSYGTEASFSSDADATTTIADGLTYPARSLYFKVTSGVSLTATRTLTIAPNDVSKIWIIENATSGSQSINISQGSGANITIPAGDTKVVYSDGAGAGAAFFDAFASLSVVDLKVQDDLTVTDDASIGGDATITGTLGVTGVFTGTSLDISGDIDVDGTTNLDVVDIDGALTQDGGAVFNEAGADVDFRVESDTVDHALFVQGSDGFVGIGTNSPVQVLHLGGASNKAIQITSSTSNAGYFGVYQDQAGFSVNRDASNGTFADAGKTEAAIVLQSQNANSFIAFRTTPTNNAEAPERLRIDKDGNVGIGTTVAPGINGKGLTIFDALYPRLTFRNDITGDSSAASVGTASYLIGDDFYLYNQEPAGQMIFGAGGAERARITAAGQLAVGTTGYGTGVLAYNRDVGAAFGMNITENTTFNDASGHIFYSKQNTHFVTYIAVTGVGITAIPAYPNGGGGVAYTWNYLDPDAGTWTYGAGTVTFTMGGSPSNAFTVAFAGGSGQITITRTSGSSLYRVVMMEFAQQ
jgi:hypothetical protein